MPFPPSSRGANAPSPVILRRRSRRRIFPPGRSGRRKKLLRSAQDDKRGSASLSAVSKQPPRRPPPAADRRRSTRAPPLGPTLPLRSSPYHNIHHNLLPQIQPHRTHLHPALEKYHYIPLLFCQFMRNILSVKRFFFCLFAAIRHLRLQSGPEKAIIFPTTAQKGRERHGRLRGFTGPAGH